MRLWKSQILNDRTKNQAFLRAHIFFAIIFCDFGETIESWRHRFFQNWYTTGLIGVLNFAKCLPPYHANYNSRIIVEVIELLIQDIQENLANFVYGTYR